MNWQRILICKILQDKELRRVKVQYRLTPNTLSDPLAIRIFAEIDGHYRKYGEVPSVELVKDKFPEFDYQEINDSLDVVCDKVQSELMRREVASLFSRYEHLLQENPRKFVKICKNQVERIHQVFNTRSFEDKTLDELYDPVMEDYWQSKHTQGLVGIPYPWSSLNQATGGLEPEQFVLIYANSAMMKTWVLVYCCYFWAAQSGQKCLFITREMSKEQISRRILSFVAGVDYRKLRTGTLNEEEEKKLIEANEKVKEIGQNIIISEAVDEDREFTLDVIRMKLEEVCPTILLLDGMHLLRIKGSRDRDWTNFMTISQDMKQIAKEFRLSVIATSQANRRGSAASRSADDIAFTYDFFRDTDVVLRLLYSRDRHMIAVLIKKSREGEEGAFVIEAKPGISMQEDKTFPIVEVDDWVKQIAREAEKLRVPSSNGIEEGKEEEDIDIDVW